MRYVIDTPYEIEEEVKYASVSQHRRYTNSNKSQWLISIAEELSCFTLCYEKQWIDADCGWGVHLVNNRMQILGKNNVGDLYKIAKFVYGNQAGFWHGYPADYRGKNQDRPSYVVLESWREEGIIRKHQIRKIRSGMACNL